jgi:hypothetical protein
MAGPTGLGLLLGFYAAPTELGKFYFENRGYKHGAPNGAWCLPILEPVIRYFFLMSLQFWDHFVATIQVP